VHESIDEVAASALLQKTLMEKSPDAIVETMVGRKRLIADSSIDLIALWTRGTHATLS
jgi:hypothetical protein